MPRSAYERKGERKVRARERRDKDDTREKARQKIITEKKREKRSFHKKGKRTDHTREKALQSNAVCREKAPRSTGSEAADYILVYA